MLSTCPKLEGELLIAQAVTSSGSAEQIAVSSLITYDLYGTYINPRASAKQLIAVSRSVVVIYGLIMGVPEPPPLVSLQSNLHTIGCPGMSLAFPMYLKHPSEESRDHRSSHFGIASWDGMPSFFSLALRHQELLANAGELPYRCSVLHLPHSRH